MALVKGWVEAGFVVAVASGVRVCVYVCLSMSVCVCVRVCLCLGDLPS